MIKAGFSLNSMLLKWWMLTYMNYTPPHPPPKKIPHKNSGKIKKQRLWRQDVEFLSSSASNSLHGLGQLLDFFESQFHPMQNGIMNCLSFIPLVKETLLPHSIKMWSGQSKYLFFLNIMIGADVLTWSKEDQSRSRKRLMWMLTQGALHLKL